MIKLLDERIAETEQGLIEAEINNTDQDLAMIEAEQNYTDLELRVTELEAL